PPAPVARYPTVTEPAVTPAFLFDRHAHHRELHSFPTRRSSDLRQGRVDRRQRADPVELLRRDRRPPPRRRLRHPGRLGAAPLAADRKSTRLNSSHVKISYAVFCLKKKNNKRGKQTMRRRMIVRR